MKKFFLALLLAASAACMAAQVAFADDSGFIAGGGSAGSGSGVGRDDIATSETASGVGRDDVLAFGSDMKDSVDKYGGGLGEGIDYANTTPEGWRFAERRKYYPTFTSATDKP